MERERTRQSDTKNQLTERPGKERVMRIERKSHDPVTVQINSVMLRDSYTRPVVHIHAVTITVVRESSSIHHWLFTDGQ